MGSGVSRTNASKFELNEMPIIKKQCVYYRAAWGKRIIAQGLGRAQKYCSS